MADSFELPLLAWSKKEGNIYSIGLKEKIYDQIGSVIEMSFPEPGLELLPGENLFSISGTTEDFQLKAPVKCFFLEKNDDTLENYHFNEENWIIKYEVKE